MIATHLRHFLIIVLTCAYAVNGMKTPGTGTMTSSTYDVWLHNYAPNEGCTVGYGSFGSASQGCDSAVVTCWFRYNYGNPAAITNAYGSNKCFFGVLSGVGGPFTFSSLTQNGITNNPDSCTRVYTISNAYEQNCFIFGRAGPISLTMYGLATVITVLATPQFYWSDPAVTLDETTARNYFSALQVQVYPQTNWCTVAGCAPVGSLLTPDCSAYTLSNTYCKVTINPVALGMVAGNYRLCQATNYGPLALVNNNDCLQDFTYDSSSVTITLTQTTQNRKRYVKATFTSALTAPAGSDYLALWPSSSSPTACSG
eukprot:PhF_6_TR6298/c0_g1_i2/m.9541